MNDGKMYRLDTSESREGEFKDGKMFGKSVYYKNKDVFNQLWDNDQVILWKNIYRAEDCALFKKGRPFKALDSNW